MSAPRCWAEIDHSALRHNAGVLRERVGPDAALIAVVKADGYGHGGPAVAKTLAPLVEQFGVASLGEARAVRAAVPDRDILILSPCLPEERAEAVAEGFIPVVSSLAEASSFAALSKGQPVRVHLAVDTGMGRIGVWQDEALPVAAALARMEGIAVESVSTHLPVADSDAEFTTAELEAWASLMASLRALLPDAKFHALNSAASLARPVFAADRVRPGLALYGVSPLPDFQEQLRPVLALKTRITLVREVGAGRGISYGRDFITPHPMRIATLAMGYADGYPRQVSGRGAHVLIRGQRSPVVGRITMDQFMVDVSGLSADVGPGEEVVLIGRQGQEAITVDEVAGWAGTISWDIFTRLGRRVVADHVNRR